MIAGNYQGITIIKIIGKVLDIILATHQEAAIPDTHNLQFSFTKGRAPSHATLLVNEAIAESRDKKKPLFTATMDIQKAFDLVPHSHLLRSLYMQGLTGKWWMLKKSAYTDMHTKVIWNGDVGDIIKLLQSTRQGGIASVKDFKSVMKTSTNIMDKAKGGTHIGDTHIGIITCADDVVLLADSIEALQFQVELFTELANMERMKIHPQKTSISIRDGFNYLYQLHLQLQLLLSSKVQLQLQLQLHLSPKGQLQLQLRLL